MGEFQQAVTSRDAAAATYGWPRRWQILPLALFAALATGCGLLTPSSLPPSPPSATEPATTAPTGPSASGTVPASPSDQAIDPAVGRLVWLLDRAGDLGVWTTDLAGGDVRTYLANVDVAKTSLRDARLVGEDVVLIRESPAASSAELWVVPPNGAPRVLLDQVDSFVVSGELEVLAVRDDEASTRAIWRVPTTGASPTLMAQVPLPAGGPDLGPFGFAISPDGRSVAMGWVGGPLSVIGPNPQSLHDLGAPLVVDDAGQVIAVTGRAGEAYLVQGDQLTDLAPPDSDPIGISGTSFVAWPVVGDDGALVVVEVRDLVSGRAATYQAHGLATNVREVSANLVILEGTAFDPLNRTIGVLDRQDGRFATFEASAPERQLQNGLPSAPLSFATHRNQVTARTGTATTIKASHAAG